MNAPTVIGLVIALAILMVVFRLLDWRQPRQRRAPLLRAGLVTDLTYWFATPFITHYVVKVVVLIAIGAFAWTVYGRIDKAEILSGFGPLSRLPPPVQVLMMLIVGDFIGYWNHRMFHGRRLWRFHAIHHSSTALDWLSAVRVHPINDLAGRIATTLPLLALGFAPSAAVWVAPVLAVFAILLHANLNWDFGPLRAVIASPRFHRWHHTSEQDARDKNFAGLFPVWDILFGTYYMPPGRVPERFGTETPVPDGFLPQLLHPFRRTTGKAPPAASPRTVMGPGVATGTHDAQSSEQRTTI